LNLCIDIGNTSAKIGFFDNEKLIKVKHDVTDRGIIKIVGASKPSNVMISSVRKGIGRLIERCNKMTPTILLDHKTAIPIKSEYESPETLGVDRISSAVGAKFLYPDKACLIVDLGTCITIDLLDSDGVYQGGSISPGLKMRLKAMHKFTSGLPLIAANSSPELIGKTTKECIQSGAINGTAAELESIIGRYQQFFEDLIIIFCGGDAIFFESKINHHIFALPNLVLIGLNHILRYNLND